MAQEKPFHDSQKEGREQQERARELGALVGYSFSAHAEKPTEPKKAVRKWDGETPYGIHPTWCAMTIMTETTLPAHLRDIGAKALLLHDVIEDTTAGLPEGTSPEVAALVDEMTFESSDQEMELIWGRSKEARLLKMYDKTSNLLDASWMTPEKRAKYSAYLLRLADDVEANYGMLNIVRMARSIAAQ